MNMDAQHWKIEKVARCSIPSGNISAEVEAVWATIDGTKGEVLTLSVFKRSGMVTLRQGAGDTNLETWDLKSARKESSTRVYHQDASLLILKMLKSLAHKCRMLFSGPDGSAECSNCFKLIQEIISRDEILENHDVLSDTELDSSPCSPSLLRSAEILEADREDAGCSSIPLRTNEIPVVHSETSAFISVDGNRQGTVLSNKNVSDAMTKNSSTWQEVQSVDINNSSVNENAGSNIKLPGVDTPLLYSEERNEALYNDQQTTMTNRSLPGEKIKCSLTKNITGIEENTSHSSATTLDVPNQSPRFGSFGGTKNFSSHLGKKINSESLSRSLTRGDAYSASKTNEQNINSNLAYPALMDKNVLCENVPTFSRNIRVFQMRSNSSTEPDVYFLDSTGPPDAQSTALRFSLQPRKETNSPKVHRLTPTNRKVSNINEKHSLSEGVGDLRNKDPIDTNPKHVNGRDKQNVPSTIEPRTSNFLTQQPSCSYSDEHRRTNEPHRVGLRLNRSLFAHPSTPASCAQSPQTHSHNCVQEPTVQTLPLGLTPDEDVIEIPIPRTEVPSIKRKKRGRKKPEPQQPESAFNFDQNEIAREYAKRTLASTPDDTIKRIVTECLTDPGLPDFVQKVHGIISNY